MDITIRLNEVPIEFKDIPAITSGDKILIQEKGIKALLKQLMKLHDRYVGKTKIDYKYKNRSLNIYIESTIVPDTQKKDIFEKAIYDIFAYSTKDELSGLKFRFEWKEGKPIDWSGLQVNWEKRPVGKPRGASVAKKKQVEPKIPATSASPSKAKKPRMVRAFIEWQTGSGKFDGTQYETWGDLQEAFKAIYDEWSQNREGYEKVKIDIYWDKEVVDGNTLELMRLTDRVDVGDGSGDFNPNKEFIGDYLKNQNSAMYVSLFEDRPSENDRDSVSWTDEPETKPQETKTTKMARILTEAEFKQSYGDDWRDQLDWVDDMDNVFGQELSETELSYMMKGADVEIVGGDGNNYFVNLRMTTKNLSKKYEGYSEEDLHKLLTGLVLLADDFGSTTARQEVKALTIYMGNNKF